MTEKLTFLFLGCEPDSDAQTFVDMLKHKLSKFGSNHQDDEPQFNGPNPKLLSLYSARYCLKDISICVRLIDQDSLEQIGYSEKTKREYLMGTSGMFKLKWRFLIVCLMFRERFFKYILLSIILFRSALCALG